MNIKAMKIMIHAVFAFDARSSHKAPMAAMNWSKADEIKPITVIISGLYFRFYILLREYFK
jgi:hypothetical protein